MPSNRGQPSSTTPVLIGGLALAAAIAVYFVARQPEPPSTTPPGWELGNLTITSLVPGQRRLKALRRPTDHLVSKAEGTTLVTQRSATNLTGETRGIDMGLFAESYQYDRLVQFSDIYNPVLSGTTVDMEMSWIVALDWRAGLTPGTYAFFVDFLEYNTRGEYLSTLEVHQFTSTIRDIK